MKTIILNDYQSNLPERISLILAAYNTAKIIEAINVNSYNLHELKGDRFIMLYTCFL
ncbi:MAG: hypothetical protein ACUZ8H_02450 [Candidatus Anammoxibacter sp.]